MDLSQIYGIRGELPPEIGNLTGMGQLKVVGEGLTGSIPPELGNLTNLTLLTISADNMEGEIPPEMGNLRNLKFLTIQSRGLSGSIPPELGNLTNLESLHIYSDNLEGEIPREIGNLRNLKSLIIQTRGLTGSIPPELGNLENLETLTIPSSNLEGAIPPELANLREIRVLDLSNNRLSGEIAPALLKHFSRVDGLNLRYNQLSGNIPGDPRILHRGFVTALAGNDVIIPEDFVLSAIGWYDSNLMQSPLKEWPGVTTDASGAVTGLKLDRTMRGSERPLHALALLKKLKVLDLSGGLIHREAFSVQDIPPKLEVLDMSGTEFPIELQDWAMPPALGVLNLRGSTVSGCVPASLQAQLDLSRSDLNNLPPCPTEAEAKLIAEREVLMAFYEYTSGYQWWDNTNWGSDKPVGEWFGVETNAQGHVIAIILQDNYLEGYIPTELATLAQLTTLELGGNGLEGCVPKALADRFSLDQLGLENMSFCP